MNENWDMENWVRVQMYEFDFVVLQWATKEIVGGKTKSMVKEGREHHNLLSIACQEVHTFGRLPLKHHAIRKEMILNKFENFALVLGGLLEHVWMGSWHGEGKEDLGWEIRDLMARRRSAQEKGEKW
jgi:hypothetical protein